MQSCCSLIASTSAAAPRAIESIRFKLTAASAAACCLRQLQPLLAACVCFSCCSQLRLFQLLPDCVRFGCCSPDGVRFNCCFLIASHSTAAPHQLFWKIPAHAQCSQTFFAEFEVQKHEGRTSRVYSPAPRASHFHNLHTHTHTHTQTNTRLKS